MIMVIFGLSRGNTRKLHEGQPILVDLSELGLPGNVLIFAAETEAALTAQIGEFISPDTKVTDRIPAKHKS